MLTALPSDMANAVSITSPMVSPTITAVCDPNNRGMVSTLAHEINLDMDRNPEARVRFAQVWGHAWVPLPAIDGSQYFVPSQDPSPAGLWAAIDDAFASITQPSTPVQGTTTRIRVIR